MAAYEPTIFYDIDIVLRNYHFLISECSQWIHVNIFQPHTSHHAMLQGGWNELLLDDCGSEIGKYLMRPIRL